MPRPFNARFIVFTDCDVGRAASIRQIRVFGDLGFSVMYLAVDESEAYRLVAELRRRGCRYAVVALGHPLPVSRSFR